VVQVVERLPSKDEALSSNPKRVPPRESEREPSTGHKVVEENKDEVRGPDEAVWGSVRQPDHRGLEGGQEVWP
jgi:hypothetical protein